MPEKKANINQLFKNGEDFMFNEVDYSTSAASDEIKELQKEQESLMKSSEVDINELKKIVFTI